MHEDDNITYIVFGGILLIIVAFVLFTLIQRDVNEEGESLPVEQITNSLDPGDVIVSETLEAESREENSVLGQELVAEEPIVDVQAAPDSETLVEQQEAVVQESVDYKALIKTNKGEILIDLYEDLSPKTVQNFVDLANKNFYDGIIFHRIIKDFMIQTGDPTGTGTGGPGYKFDDEFNSKKLVLGSVAMANSGPNTNGSQFFIVTTEATPWLDGKHTNFGEVVAGMEVVKAIEGVPTGPGDKPLEEVKMLSVEIIEE